MSYPVADNELNEPSAASPAAQFDVKKFIFKLLGFLPWIIISVLISYSVATLYLRYTAQVHRISAQLQIKDNEQSSADYNILTELGVTPGGKEVQDQIDILQSFALAKGVVDSLRLQFEIVAKGRIASSPLYGKMTPAFIRVLANDTITYKPASYSFLPLENRFSIAAVKEEAVTHNYGDTFFLDGHQVYFLKNNDIKFNTNGYILNIKDPRSVAGGIRSSIDVRKLHDNGGILEVSTKDEVPDKAIDIINVLVGIFNTAALSEKSIVSNKTNKFLNDRVDAVEKELNDLEIKAGEFKRVNKITDPSAAGSQYLSEVSAYDHQRVDQTEEAKLLEALYTYVKQAQNNTGMLLSSTGINDPALGVLVSQYNSAVINYNAQTKISTERDPILARLRSELNGLKESILITIANTRAGLRARLDEINSQYDRFSYLLAGIPEKERILVELKRQISVKEQLYLFLLQKKENAELSLAVVTGDSRIVDTAHDQGVILPNASQIKMFAILLGVLLPIVIMLLLDFFNNRITDRREVESGTRVPFLGELSYNKNQKHAIVNPNSRSVLAEQFRLIRTNLQYLASDKKAKIILITSFMSGEGKSFVSLNLAGSLVTGDKKVLLLELDLRKPKLSRYLNIATNRGLTDYLANDNSIEAVISKIPGVANIDVITSGPVPPNPTELIMSEKLDKLLELAKQQYDYIVIDSSPVGLVADAFLVGHKVDITLFIVRHKYSYKTTIKYIDKLYTDKKLNRLSIVMNGIIASSGLGYGYGYGYGYSYGYGYHYGAGYYTEDNKKGIRSWLDKVFKK